MTIKAAFWNITRIGSCQIIISTACPSISIVWKEWWSAPVGHSLIHWQVRHCRLCRQCRQYNVDNVDNVENVDNVDNVDNVENVENVDNVDNVDNYYVNSFSIIIIIFLFVLRNSKTFQTHAVMHYLCLFILTIELLMFE